MSYQICDEDWKSLLYIFLSLYSNSFILLQFSFHFSKFVFGLTIVLKIFNKS